MKFLKLYLASAIAAMALSACVSEDIPTGNEGKGKMLVDVDILRPQSTRAVETKDFPITIYKSDGTVEKEYEKLTDVPKQIPLSVGQYTVEAHTPGTMIKIMDNPYYWGTEPVTILKGINTQADVTCRMANGSFKVNYSDNFINAFSHWELTIDDGTESVLVYDSYAGTSPKIKYMVFEQNVMSLNVNFRGTTKNGNQVSTSNTLTKRQATEQYDNDNEYFSGGDAIVLNIEPVESTEGDVTSIHLTANIQFEESEETFEMEVEDKESEEEDNGGNEGNGGNNNGGEGNGGSTITLDLPEDMTVSATTDPTLGNTYITAEHGLKSIMVKMSSTSADMITSLQALSVNYNGVDFINGAEVVDNKEMERLFTGLGKTLTTPSQGDTEYTFPIGNFFTLLAFLPGVHTFDLVITDMQNNTKDGRLVLTVNKN